MTATPPEAARLPAHLEVAALIRRVEQAGGFAMVIQKGERETGSILVILAERGADQRLYERMPSASGERVWHCSRRQNGENPQEFAAYLERRRIQDPDLWMIELDIANGEQFVGLDPAAG